MEILDLEGSSEIRSEFLPQWAGRVPPVLAGMLETSNTAKTATATATTTYSIPMDDSDAFNDGCEDVDDFGGLLEELFDSKIDIGEGRRRSKIVIIIIMKKGKGGGVGNGIG